MKLNENLIIDIIDITEAAKQNVDKLDWLNNELMKSSFVSQSSEGLLEMFASIKSNQLITEMEADYIILIKQQLEDILNLLMSKSSI